ncbi:MAG: nicotinamide-nucleotide amidohydrolase family protein [Rhodospirillaceae bacterium]|nr:nicotinamide-nucleotide amidohydrolase family protein [Rhodospirillaceae bacterium]MDD9998832.1 nicotinamide-nucleotide amidohydrolase family protein [Rhodospirillaceae bacterium]MDE0363234.1 nicotinamide-nucleotide amidohydrolase family protein [Rhodospirillaceae bacterium]
MAPSDVQLTELASAVGEALARHGAGVACVESCTGGWIAKALTDVPGSSAWFGWGWVTYANDAKRQLVGVPDAILATHGAVSEVAVAAMARAGRILSGADFAVAVSGVAGPDGGTPEKPVGTVWFGWDGPADVIDRVRPRAGDTSVPGITERRMFAGDRESIRRQAVSHALRGLLDVVEGHAARAGPG